MKLKSANEKSKFFIAGEANMKPEENLIAQKELCSQDCYWMCFPFLNKMELLQCSCILKVVCGCVYSV